MTSISSAQDFKAHVEQIAARPGFKQPIAFALGVATVSPSGKILDTAYPVVNREENNASAAVLADICGHLSGTATYELGSADLERLQGVFSWTEGDGKVHPNVEAVKAIRALLDSPAPLGGTRKAVAAFIETPSDPPINASDVYLRLHLLSHRKYQPHGLNLDGAFGLLNNVVWTSAGPFDPDGFNLAKMRHAAQGHEIRVIAIDKFPRMIDYVIPTGVRIADGGRVRLGAHLAEGTTVMHEGFCNFNAGTLGTSMVEGRISAGVVVGNGSDVGGGASIMGTLSGGGKEVISLGEGCLLGANSGLGIPLGNKCIVEAGLYITAGTRVALPDGVVVKARELAGHDNLLFRRNSLNGAVEVVANGASWTGLNSALHKN